MAPFQTASAFTVTGPGYDLVVARAAPGTSQAALAATLRARPGMSGYQVQTGSQLATSEANSAVHFTQQFTTFILVFALIALVVACIVIYNTFTILITQRGRELALLRCVGASRGQVFRSTLLESAITGLIAAAGRLTGPAALLGADGKPVGCSLGTRAQRSRCAGSPWSRGICLRPPPGSPWPATAADEHPGRPAGAGRVRGRRDPRVPPGWRGDRPRYDRSTLLTLVFSSAQASTDAEIEQHYPFDYVVQAQGDQLVPPRIVRALAGSAGSASSRPTTAARR